MTTDVLVLAPEALYGRQLVDEVGAAMHVAQHSVAPPWSKFNCVLTRIAAGADRIDNERTKVRSHAAPHAAQLLGSGCIPSPNLKLKCSPTTRAGTTDSARQRRAHAALLTAQHKL